MLVPMSRRCRICYSRLVPGGFVDRLVAALVSALARWPWCPRSPRRAAGTLQTPEQFLGFKVGADNKLARWDKIVDYMKLAAASSDRVRFRELGKTSNSNPFIALEISCARHAEESRPLQAARTQALFPGRRADRRASATRSSGRASWCAHHLQHPRDRDRRVADGRSSWCTASRPTTRRR